MDRPESCEVCVYTKLLRKSAEGLLLFSTDVPTIEGLYLVWNEDDRYELVSWMNGDWS